MWPKHKNKCFIFSNKSAEFSGICVIFSTNNLLDNNGLYHTHLGRTISFQQHFIICFSVQLLHQKHYSQEELSKCVQSHVSTDCVCVYACLLIPEKKSVRDGADHITVISDLVSDLLLGLTVTCCLCCSHFWARNL